MKKECELSPTDLSILSGIHRKDIIGYIKLQYPLFIIGKDKLDLNMAKYIVRQLRIFK